MDQPINHLSNQPTNQPQPNQPTNVNLLLLLLLTMSVIFLNILMHSEEIFLKLYHYGELLY